MIEKIVRAVAVAEVIKLPGFFGAKARSNLFLIEEHFNEPQLDTVNRMLFAMAAYNAGPAKIEKCRDLAEQMGYDRNKWFNNVELVIADKIGTETTTYVRNIYKYYVAYKLTLDAQAEAENARLQVTPAKH